MPTPLQTGLRRSLDDPVLFSEVFMPGRKLRSYQRPFVQAVAGSIQRGRGLEFLAVFSRQSGKDEALAQLCAWLLNRYQFVGGSVVVAVPAVRPQGILARDRLLERLQSPLTEGRARVREGTIVELGRASVRYLSAARTASSRGNTASLLLVANEAQDIDPDVWDAVFAPMAASTNATTLFMGTVWTSDTLLARQTRALKDQEGHDGRKRVFRVAWREVAAELPVYGDYVRRQMALLGEQHPFIRTEYELEEFDGAGRLFPPERLAGLTGCFGALERPTPDGPPGTSYALLVDVAGEVEEGLEGLAARQAGPRRDSTAATVVRVLPGKLAEPPRYQIVARYLWTGTRHTDLHARLVGLANETWKVRTLVVDATGIGAGLASFLRNSLGERRVKPFVFSLASKSKLAWDFLGLLEAGRLQTFDPGHGADASQRELDRLFHRQITACRYTVLAGPGRLLRWGVEDPALHDDLLISATLVATLDDVDFRPREAVGRSR
jgi:hypothetical protein